MNSNRIPTIAAVLFGVMSQPLWAAPPKIVSAAVDPIDRSLIIINFDNPTPARAAVNNPRYWIIFQTTASSTTRLLVMKVNSWGLLGDEKVVLLSLKKAVADAPNIKSLSVMLANSTDVVQVDPMNIYMSTPRTVEAPFSPAKSKSDADIYFNGSYAAVRDGDPVYDVDAFAGYMHVIQRDKTEYGKIGLYGQVRTKMNATADPNSFLTYLVYQKVLSDNWWLGTFQAPIINYRFFGAEFDRTAKELNLINSPVFTIPFRPIRPPANLSNKTLTWPQFNLLLGTEFVDVRKSVMAPVGKWHTRGVMGATFALGYGAKKEGFDSLQLTSAWQLRLPSAPEVFYDNKFAPIDPTTGKKNAKKTPPMLGTQPRHNFDTKVTYNFSLWGGVTFEHTYGSLPPSFIKTDHTFAVGLSISLQQASYGRYSILRP